MPGGGTRFLFFPKRGFFRFFVSRILPSGKLSDDMCTPMACFMIYISHYILQDRGFRLNCPLCSTDQRAQVSMCCMLPFSYHEVVVLFCLCKSHYSPSNQLYIATWTTETRQGEYIFFISFKTLAFYFVARFLSFVILKAIQCLLERSSNTTPHL